MIPLYDIDEDLNHTVVEGMKRYNTEQLNGCRTYQQEKNNRHPSFQSVEVNGLSNYGNPISNGKPEKVDSDQYNLLWTKPEFPDEFSIEEVRTMPEIKNSYNEPRSSNLIKLNNSPVSPGAIEIRNVDRVQNASLFISNRKRPNRFINSIARRLQNRKTNRQNSRHGYFRACDDPLSEIVIGKQHNNPNYSKDSLTLLEREMKMRSRLNKNDDLMRYAMEIASEEENNVRNPCIDGEQDGEDIVGVNHRSDSLIRYNSYQNNEDDNEEEDGLDKFSHRVAWLITLVMLQSLSGTILDSFEKLIRHHPVVVVFLTMLIGSGGNAGSQSAVLIVRRLATGKLRRRKYLSTLSEQFIIGCLISIILTIVCFLRIYFFEGDLFEVLAICLSMTVIVVSSVLLGTALPILFHLVKIDPAHSSAAVQVLVDVIGVTITCLVSMFILDRIAPRWDPKYLQSQPFKETPSKRFLSSH